MTKWEKFSKEELESIIKNSYSIAQTAEKIGYKGGSGSTQVKKMIEYYHFDISHFKGQGWNKNNFDYGRFRKNNIIRSSSALSALTYKRGHICENCGLETWLNKPIPLEVHHKDGDRLNNEEDNLILLCPNCHAFTFNYRGKNIGKTEPVPENKFVEALQNSPNIRQALLSLGLTAKGANYERAKKLIKKYNISNSFGAIE